MVIFSGIFVFLMENFGTQFALIILGVVGLYLRNEIGPNSFREFNLQGRLHLIIFFIDSWFEIFVFLNEFEVAVIFSFFQTVLDAGVFASRILLVNFSMK